MKRKIFLIILSLLIIGAAAYFYLDTVFLPVQFKNYLTTKATQRLNRTVTIGTLDFQPFQGLVIDDLTIAEKDKPEQVFFKSRRITFNILLAPFFQKKAVIIPFIKIEDPFLSLRRNKKGRWNFDDLRSLETASTGKLPPILLRKMVLRGGIVDLADHSRKEEFSEHAENIAIDTILSLNKGIRFIAQAKIPAFKSQIKVKGNYTLLTHKLSVQGGISNVDIPRYLSLLKPKTFPLNVEQGLLSSAELTANYQGRDLDVQGSIYLDQVQAALGEQTQLACSVAAEHMAFALSDGKWDLGGQFKLSDLSVTDDKKRTWSGQIDADLKTFTMERGVLTGSGNANVQDAYFKISDHEYFKGHVKATEISLTQNDQSVEFNGNISVERMLAVVNEDMALKGDLSANDTQVRWSTNGEQPAINMGGNIKLDSAFLTLGADKTLEGNLTAPKSSLSYDSRLLTFESQGQLLDAKAHWDKQKEFTGHPHYHAMAQYHFDRSDPWDYKSTIHFSDGQLKGVPTIGTIEKIDGTVTVTPGKIESNEIVLDTQDTSIKLSGTLDGFADPDLDIKASCEQIDLEQLFTLFPGLAAQLHGTATGQAAVDMNYRGPLKDPPKAAVSAKADISRTTVSLDALDQDITDISGTVQYQKDLLQWDNLIGNYLNRTYTLNGQLSDFSRPVIDTTVTAQQLSVIAQIKLLKMALQLTDFRGRYLNTEFDLKGDAHFYHDAEPDLDIRGSLDLELSDLDVFAPRFKDVIARHKPSGKIAGEGLFIGKYRDWRNWKVVFDGKSDLVRFDGHPFENVVVQFAQRDDAINKYNVTATIYDGLVNLESSADLRGEQVPFNAEVTLQNMKLEKLTQKNNKRKNLGGRLTAQATLKGEGKNFRQLTGYGSFDISEGNIWKWDIIDGMSKIMLIPEFQSLTFNEAHGRFTIQDQKVLTEDTHFIGDTATLDAKGWVDFDKNLNFDITPTFSEIAILKSDSAKKKPTSILTQTEGYIKIRLTGTVDHPKFNVEKFPVKLIEETIGGTTGTLKEVIGDIVDEIFY